MQNWTARALSQKECIQSKFWFFNRWASSSLLIHHFLKIRAVCHFPLSCGIIFKVHENTLIGIHRGQRTFLCVGFNGGHFYDIKKPTFLKQQTASNSNYQEVFRITLSSSLLMLKWTFLIGCTLFGKAPSQSNFELKLQYLKNKKPWGDESCIEWFVIPQNMGSATKIKLIG